MELKPLKNGEVAITVTYHITNELVNKKLSFIRNGSLRIKGCYDGISAIYVDDGGRKKPTSTITFTEPGEHVVRIVLEDNTVVPYAILWGADEVYSVEIPDTVTEIESAAFYTSITCPPVLPPNLKTIVVDALKYWDVSFLQLPDSVETVERDNFYGVKHLVVGKNFQGDVGFICRNHEKVTIPADNKYLEVKDGFVIDRVSKELLGILPGTFEDSTDVTIRFPEGISCLDPDIIENFNKVSVSVPSSVEKCELVLGNKYGDDTTIRTVECAEGLKELIIVCSGKVKLSLPNTVTKLELYGMTPIDLQIPRSISEMALRVTMEELHIPSGVKLRHMEGTVNRLYLGQNITLEGTHPYHLFDNFKGEVFVEGTVHFDEWGKMKDDSVIHVPDEEIGRKIFNSNDFNKKVKIFIGDNKLLSDQEEGAQDKRIFNLLGVPDLPYRLQPIDSSHVITLLFDLQEKTQVRIRTDDDDKYRYYALDDKPLKKKKLSNGALEIDIQKGIHVIRLITSKVSGEGGSGPSIEPACEVMLIDDNYSLDSIAKNMKGVKHLILGVRCHLEYVNSLADLPYSKISVVPENQWLEFRDGCIIDRESQQLLLVNSEVKKLPDGISGISHNALRRFNNERLVIPSCSKSVVLKRAYLWSHELGRCVKNICVEDGLDNIKELVFEEGIEEIELCYCSFSQDVAITFPKTLNEISIKGVVAERMRIPVSCNLVDFQYSHISNLDFLGDVKLRPDMQEYKSDYVFDNFSGNINFQGEVSPFPKYDPDEDKKIFFIGKLNDDCTITVSSQAISDAIRNCKDYNPNVKIIVE